MATEKEIQKELRDCKKELRELRTHNKFLTDRLELAHERNAELRKKIMTMTIDDVVAHQQEYAKYHESYLKDKELVEAFDKQSQVKLNALGTDNGNTI